MLLPKVWLLGANERHVGASMTPKWHRGQRNSLLTITTSSLTRDRGHFSEDELAYSNMMCSATNSTPSATKPSLLSRSVRIASAVAILDHAHQVGPDAAAAQRATASLSPWLLSPRLSSGRRPCSATAAAKMHARCLRRRTWAFGGSDSTHRGVFGDPASAYQIACSS
jgi:hypothetical protein